MGNQLFPIVKAADEAITQVGNATTPLSTAIGSTLADVWQGIVGDRVAAWRVRNAAGIHEQLTTYVVEKNLSLDFSRIPEGFAFTWFEQATTHEEPEVQQLFATILANAALGNDEALQRRNLEIIGRFSVYEAKLIQTIIQQVRRKLVNSSNKAERISWSADPNDLESEYVKMKIIPDLRPVENLVSLGVLTEDRVYQLDDREMRARLTQIIAQETGKADNFGCQAFDYALQEYIEYNLTLTGKSLIRALDPLLLDVSD